MKAKRKVHPYNSKQYWIIFSVLAVLLLIPFRLINRSDVQNTIYFGISIFTSIVLSRFISRYNWRQKIVILMIVCFFLPLGQSLILKWESRRTWACKTETIGIIDIHICDTNPCGSGEMVQYASLRHTPIGVLILPVSWNGKFMLGLC